MGKPTGFMEYRRETPKKRLVTERVRDYREIDKPFAEEKLVTQAARCMDCGAPFCHAGCPLGNLIPDWSDLVCQEQWKRAFEALHATNNFPEFTGRLCPAPCEEACVLAINELPVTIREIEKAIIERAFAHGWVQPQPPARRTGKRVAIVGSGPTGLACAQQLNRSGHWVTVLERDDRIGGLLRYGIPDFKLEKRVLDRRLRLMMEEGVVFKTQCEVGKNYAVEQLGEFDAVVLCAGAAKPRDLPIPGRELRGIHFAMECLPQQNRRAAGEDLRARGIEEIHARGKHVVIIGGGDTGSDCVGTANRQGAKSITQFELLGKPPAGRPAHQPWPYWPMRLRISTSHEEGVQQHWNISTKAFLGANGKVQKVRTVNVEFVEGEGGRLQMRETPRSGREWPADLVLLAMGFTGPEPNGVVARLGAELDDRGNVRTGEDYMTSVPGVFAAGDARRGQSLIVWAISEGREAARSVDQYLMGNTELPGKGPGDLPRV